MAVKNATASAPVAVSLIKSIPSTSDEDNTADFRRLIPAWIISGVVHVVLLSVFLLVTVAGGQATPNTELAVIESKVEDGVQEKNLVNEDIGNDPDLPTNYNIDRIEEVSVPGPVVPDQTVGILNAPAGPAQTIPPPPGFGGNTGQGGGIDDPTRAGAGALFGTAGGLGGPRLLPGGFGGRSGSTREKMLREGGGNSYSEAAVAAGLGWLVRHQDNDGSWSPGAFNKVRNCTCGDFGHPDPMFGTAIALLPLLGAGETHKGTGKHHMYAKNVERAMKWLVQHQNADGVFSGNGYINGIATMSICELYGLSADPLLRGPAQRALTAVVNWQGPDGGWRYQPKQNGDTSVFSWNLQAVKSGQMAGLEVPNGTFKAAGDFLDKVSVPDGSWYGYTSPGQSFRLTAIGALSRQYLGCGVRHPGLNRAVETLRKLPPAETYKDMYYYYYATQVMHHMGGEVWDQWNPRMRDMLIAAQDKGTDPNHRDQKGSFDPKGWSFCNHFGRLAQTALCVLTLEVYYRHLPLYRRELANAKFAPAREGQ